MSKYYKRIKGTMLYNLFPLSDAYWLRKGRKPFNFICSFLLQRTEYGLSAIATRNTSIKYAPPQMKVFLIIAISMIERCQSHPIINK